MSRRFRNPCYPAEHECRLNGRVPACDVSSIHRPHPGRHATIIAAINTFVVALPAIL
jgi:hypothetical protein